MRDSRRRRHPTIPSLAGTVLGSLVLLGSLLQGCSSDAVPIRIGVLADCVGNFRNLQEPALAGAEIPLLERGATLRGPSAIDGVTAATIAGHPIELVPGCIEGGEYNSVIEQARQLIEVEHADAVLGGTYPGDGLAIREVARKYPGVAFVVNNSGDREVTSIDPAPNVFQFAADISQQVAGLGTYAFRDLGWRHALVVIENNEVGWSGAAGFLAEFCGLGGQVSQVPMAPDLSAPAVPDADGVAVFLTQFGKTPALLEGYAGGRTPLESSLLLGPGVWSDLNSLNTLPDELKQVVTVVPVRSVPASAQYRDAVAEFFPDVTMTDAMQPFVVQNHDGMQAVLTALERTGGTVGTGGAALQEALGTLDIDLVSGRVRLDDNRAAIVSTALTRLGEVGPAAFGLLQAIRTVPDVDQTFGGALPATYQPGAGEQPCSSGPVPPWAR